MFDAIGLLLFGLIVMLVAYYYSMVLMDALWNSSGARKARKDAIEALINAEKLIERYREYEV